MPVSYTAKETSDSWRAFAKNRSCVGIDEQSGFAAKADLRRAQKDLIERYRSGSCSACFPSFGDQCLNWKMLRFGWLAALNDNLVCRPTK